MKTREELNAFKNEVEALNKKLAELTEDELKQVSGGETWWLVDLGKPAFEPVKANPDQNVAPQTEIVGKGWTDTAKPTF